MNLVRIAVVTIVTLALLAVVVVLAILVNRKRASTSYQPEESKSLANQPDTQPESRSFDESGMSTPVDCPELALVGGGYDDQTSSSHTIERLSSMSGNFETSLDEVGGVTEVLGADVSQQTDPSMEYTLVPIDSVPLGFEIKALDLTDRSQGQYIPSYRDSITFMPKLRRGKTAPLRKNGCSDLTCDQVVSEHEYTRTASFTDMDEAAVPQYMEPPQSNLIPSAHSYVQG